MIFGNSPYRSSTFSISTASGATGLKPASDGGSPAVELAAGQKASPLRNTATTKSREMESQNFVIGYLSSRVTLKASPSSGRGRRLPPPTPPRGRKPSDMGLDGRGNHNVARPPQQFQHGFQRSSQIRLRRVVFPSLAKVTRRLVPWRIRPKGLSIRTWTRGAISRVRASAFRG